MGGSGADFGVSMTLPRESALGLIQRPRSRRASARRSSDRSVFGLSSGEFDATLCRFPASATVCASASGTTTFAKLLDALQLEHGVGGGVGDPSRSEFDDSFARRGSGQGGRSWFAIGGIEASNVGEVVAAGATHIAAELRAALPG